MGKGYVVQSGFMGYVEDEGRYILFASEGDYQDYLLDLAVAQIMAEDELLAELKRRGKA